MPRVENRKRPPNLSGSVQSRGNHNKIYGTSTGEYQSAQSKKQDIIDKMRRIQASKSGQVKPE